MQESKSTIYVNSSVGETCKHCDFYTGHSGTDIADSINHYIQEHGYKRLHVGTESSEDNEGRLWQNTVAVLGHDNPPKKKKVVPIDVILARKGKRKEK